MSELTELERAVVEAAVAERIANLELRARGKFLSDRNVELGAAKINAVDALIAARAAQGRTA